MKKVILFFATLLALGQSAFADCFLYTYQGKTLVYDIEYGSAHVSRSAIWGNINTAVSGDVEIPSYVIRNDTTYLVTSIDEFAFYGNSGLTSVIIGNSVTSIGERAFQDCSSLASVTIGHSVTYIDYYAFINCSALTTVVFNATNCTFAGVSNSSATYPTNSPAFANCTSITNFIFGNNVRIIPNSLCCYKSGLTSVTIPNSVTRIGESAFEHCTGLTSVTIPNSVTRIGESAFEHCTGLTSVTIPNSVSHIGNDAFKGCSGLASVTFNADSCISSGTYIHCAFQNCINITHFTFGNNVKVIPPYLCISLPNLTTITIPDSVISIGRNAFAACTGLTSATIGNTVSYIDTCAFYNCSSLASISVPNSVTFIGSHAFYGCCALTSINIPNGISSIGDYTFYNCSNLTSVNFPYLMTSIGEYAFHGCSSLTSIVIPDSVISIGGYAFYNCSGLTSVSIGKSVSTIGRTAFVGCNNLTTVTFNADSCIAMFSGSVWPFHNCTNITTFTFGDNVRVIPRSLCEGLSGLTSVTIPSSVTSIGINAFADCNNLDTVIMLPVMAPVIGSYSFYNNSSSRKFYIPCGSYNSYYYGSGWSNYRYYLHEPEPDYSITVGVNNTAYGSVANTPVTCAEQTTISATANTGYHFTQWQDGNTQNPRTITLTSNATYTAYFEANTPTYYTITTTSANPAMGTVSGGGSYAAGTTVTLTATPNAGYHFTQWQDGNMQNPRTITVTGNATYTAYFESNAPVNPATVTATISEITSTSAHVEIVKGQHTSYYYYLYGPESVFTQNGLTTDEAIISYINQHYGQSDRSYDNTSGYMNSLTPSTEYLLVVVPYNSNDEVGTVCRTQFTTLSSAGTATVTATISEITATSAHAEIVKGQHTSYYYYFYGPQSVFTQNGLTTDEAIISYVNQNYSQSDRTYDNTSGYMNGLTPNTAYLLVVVPYNGNGEVGTITKKQFTTLNNNGIEDASGETYAVSCQDGRLTVGGAGGELVSVYSIDGRCVYSSRATETTVIDVPTAGVYLVKVGNTPARKVTVIR